MRDARTPTLLLCLLSISACYGSPHNKPADGAAGGGGAGHGGGGTGSGADGGAGVGGNSAGAGGGAGVGGNGGLAGGAGTGGSAGAGTAGSGGAVAGTSGADGGIDAPGPAPGTILWARSTSSVFLLGVAESSTGVVVTGDLSGPADLGGGVLTPKTAADIAIAEYGIANGSYVTSTRFGNSAPAGTGSVGGGFLKGIGPGGAPIIFGLDTCDPGGTPACNQIDLGQGLSAPGGGPAADGYIGRYSPVNGTPAWLVRLSGPGSDKILAATANGPANSIFVGGGYDSDTVLSSGTNSLSFTPVGSRDVLIFQVDTYTGTLGATSTIASAAFEDIAGIVWDGTNVVATGRFNGTTTIGAQSFISRGDDAWVAKLTPAGTPVWAISLGGTGDDSTAQVVVDAAGDVYLAGTVGGSATFGTFQIGGTGGSDVFLAKLKGSDGSVIWAKSLGSSGNDGASDLAISSSSQLLLAADVSGPITSNGPSFGAQDALFASFDADGNLRWSKVLGTVGTDYAWRIASGSDGFYGLYDPGADVGSNIEGVAIQGAPQPAGVLLKIAP